MDLTTGVIVLIVINAWTFLLMLLDKHAAKRRTPRVPERVLLLFSLLGGSLGTAAGMLLFHHKTKKLRFVIAVPVLLLIQLCFLLPVFVS